MAVALVGPRRTRSRIAGKIDPGNIAWIPKYNDKILALSPIAFWPLDDTSGTVARELVSSLDGVYLNPTGFTLGADGIGDGAPSVLFNDAGEDNGNVSTYSSGLSSVFDGAEGSHGVWTKILNASIWTDGVFRYTIHNYADGDNRMYLGKMTTSNQWRRYYESGNVGKNQTAAVTTSVDWVHWLTTWSEAADEVKTYRDGVQWGVTATSLGVWSAGALHASFQRISTTQGTVGEWKGWLAKGVIFDKPLSAAEALIVATI